MVDTAEGSPHRGRIYQFWTPFLFGPFNGGVITRDLGDGPPGIRCCRPSATSDPVSGRMYAAWSGLDPRRLMLSTSRDGVHWAAARRINADSGDALGVNVDLSAYNNVLAVSYGLTNANTSGGRFARQLVTTTRDAGAHFSRAAVVGPRIDCAFAAQARGIFPGDYIGTAMKSSVLYAVWCVSNRPAEAGARFHQVEYAATFDTRTGLRRRY